MHISVICTVLNEGESIRRLMDSLVVQSCPPDEVVIVDGGSRDNTVAVLQEYADRLPLRVVVEPGANISRGRNIAIAAATGEIIASVDAGVWLEVMWLERLIAPLEEGGAAEQQISKAAKQQISESAKQQISESANQRISKAARRRRGYSAFRIPHSAFRRRFFPRRPADRI